MVTVKRPGKGLADWAWITYLSVIIFWLEVRENDAASKAELAAKIVVTHPKRQANLFAVLDAIDPLVAGTTIVTVIDQAHRNTDDDAPHKDDCFCLHSLPGS